MSDRCAWCDLWSEDLKRCSGSYLRTDRYDAACSDFVARTDGDDRPMPSRPAPKCQDCGEAMSAGAWLAQLEVERGQPPPLGFHADIFHCGCLRRAAKTEPETIATMLAKVCTSLDRVNANLEKLIATGGRPPGVPDSTRKGD